MLKVDRSSDYLAWLIDPKPSLLGFCSEFSQIQRSKPDLFNFLNFQGFTYCLIFNYQGSLLLASSAATLIYYHKYLLLSTTFLFIFLFVFLSCDSEIYIIRSTAECQQLFNYFSKKFCRTFSHYKRVPPSTPLYYIYQMLQSSVNQNSTPSFTFCTPQALLWESMIAFTMERPMPLPP